MTGMNVLVLNHETMVEVLQQWCDGQFKNAPRVMNVTPNDMGDISFRVEMDCGEIAVEKPATEGPKRKSKRRR